MSKMAALLRTLSSVPAFRHIRKTTQKLFSKYLLVTNIGISMTLSATGDILQQRYKMVNGKHKAWDVMRTRNLAASGVTVGFTCHWWYIFLDNKLPGRAVSIVLKKVVVDQLLFSPFMWMVFFATLGVLEKTSAKDLMHETVFKGTKLWVAEFFVWPPAQTINFFLLPTRYRVMYDNVVSLGFDCYVSHIKHHT